MNPKRWRTNKLKTFKREQTGRILQMLTAYDYTTAAALNGSEIDLVLVGDSLGQVILGKESTVDTTLEEMKIFSQAVRRGLPDKYLVVDMPFGSYHSLSKGLENAVELYQSTQADALKLEGASEHIISICRRLVETGIPIMGHLGLTPQSIYQLGGYYNHGTKEETREKILQQAVSLEEAGAFCIVGECLDPDFAGILTRSLSIPLIGIGSGSDVDGQVLVINDLFGDSPHPGPTFCRPMADFFGQKQKLIEEYLQAERNHQSQ